MRWTTLGLSPVASAKWLRGADSVHASGLPGGQSDDSYGWRL